MEHGPSLPSKSSLSPDLLHLYFRFFLLGLLVGLTLEALALAPSLNRKIIRLIVSVLP